MKNQNIDESDEEPERKQIRTDLLPYVERINKLADPVTLCFKALKDNSNLYDIRYQLIEKVSLPYKFHFALG